MMLNVRSTRFLLAALWAVIAAMPLAAQSGQVARIIQRRRPPRDDRLRRGG